MACGSGNAAQKSGRETLLKVKKKHQAGDANYRTSLNCPRFERSYINLYCGSYACDGLRLLSASMPSG